MRFDIEQKDGNVVDVIGIGEDILHVVCLTVGLVGGILFIVPAVIAAAGIYGAEFFNRRGSKEEGMKIEDIVHMSPLECIMSGFTIVSAFLGGEHVVGEDKIARTTSGERGNKGDDSSSEEPEKAVKES